jgi:uncharacterized membrane protein YgdD (TMEM256/DUF423 family)
MPAKARLFIVAGCVAAMLAVAAGAFGAHALKAHLPPDMLAVFKTGVEYHYYHAFGLLLIGLAALHLPESSYLRAAGWVMLVGIVLFSGSLYLLVLSGATWLGALTPLGGLCFIVAWALFAGAFFRS